MSEAETQEDTGYARIVTNHGEMVELTDLIRLRGTGTDGTKSSLVKDAVVHFEGDEVDVEVLDPMASVWAHVRGPFDGVRSAGRLTIGSVADYREYLARFGDKTLIETEERNDGFYLTFDDEDRKQGGYSLTDEAHIKSNEDIDQLPFSYDPENDDYPTAQSGGTLIELDTWFTCDVADIKSVLDDGNTTEVRKYPITAEDGEIQVRVGDDSGWINTEFEANEGVGVASSVYGYGIDNVFSNLSGEVTVYLMDDGPMWVHQSAEDGDTNYTLDYLVSEDQME